MTIREIYKKYYIIPNLQEHMMRVCGIAEFIEKHWKGEVIDWQKMKIICLLHDIGNIVKFNFDKYPQFMGEEVRRIDYWKEKQEKIKQKYGKDDHKATKSMLEEIGLDRTGMQIILDKSFGNSIQVAESKSWVLKILYYGDLRTLPNGIGTLEERLHDVVERMPKYTERGDFENLCNASRKVEKQIQENLDVSVSKLTDERAKFSPKLLDIEVV